MAYSNPYYSSSYDEYKNRQLQQRSGQDFNNDSQVNLNKRIPTSAEIQQPQAQQSYQPAGGGNGTVGTLAGAAAGITSQLGQPKGDRGFEIDPYAGYTGSFEGLSSGGAVGAVIGGIGGEAGSFIKAGKAIDKFNAGNEIGDVRYDINGKPIYNSSGILSSQKAAKELKDAEMSATSWWQGGKAGGVAGIDTTTLFGELNGYKRKARRKRRQTQKAITSAQNSYNQQESQYQQQQNANEEYYKRMNNQDRINNLYSIPNSYKTMF